jgi:predicted SAM-dependent methyltransferase
MSASTCTIAPGRELLLAFFIKRRDEPNPNGLDERAYKAAYPDSSIEGRHFYKFGMAEDWNHRYWRRVDVLREGSKPDHSLDVTSLEPLPVGDAIGELVYSSHLIEHLTDAQAAFLFAEAARILKPGGICRITCPNIERFYAAYRMRDVFINLLYGLPYPFGEEGKNTFTSERMVIWLVNEFAGQLVQSVEAGHSPLYFEKVAELDSLFDSMPMEQACDTLCGAIDLELHRRAPAHHINWWTHRKLHDQLLSAGFSSVLNSVPGGSVAAVMRNRDYFDRTLPTLSLFVDAIK